MSPENEEFKELLERSGWKQTEAAEQLQLPASSISRYVNGVDKPAKPTLRLFKILLAGNNSSFEMRESSPRYDAAPDLVMMLDELDDLSARLRRAVNSNPKVNYEKVEELAMAMVKKDIQSAVDQIAEERQETSPLTYRAKPTVRRRSTHAPAPSK